MLSTRIRRVWSRTLTSRHGSRALEPFSRVSVSACGWVGAGGAEIASASSHLFAALPARASVALPFFQLAVQELVGLIVGAAIDLGHVNQADAAIQLLTGAIELLGDSHPWLSHELGRILIALAEQPRRELGL
jgi:hypothetical protein